MLNELTQLLDDSTLNLFDQYNTEYQNRKIPYQIVLGSFHRFALKWRYLYNAFLHHVLETLFSGQHLQFPPASLLLLQNKYSSHLHKALEELCRSFFLNTLMMDY